MDNKLDISVIKAAKLHSFQTNVLSLIAKNQRFNNNKLKKNNNIF